MWRALRGPRPDRRDEAVSEGLLLLEDVEQAVGENFGLYDRILARDLADPGCRYLLAPSAKGTGPPGSALPSVSCGRGPMRWVAVLALAGGVLAGCADQPPLIDRVSKGKVMGDASQVSVEGGRLDALPLAIAHCARYGRSAQWSHEADDRSVYDCVAKP